MKFQISLALLAAVVAIAPSILAEENFGPEFAALKTQYDLRVKSDVQQVFDAAIADLNTKYTATLDRSLESAQKAGRLDDAVALKAEVEAIAQGKGVPAKDDDKTPATLKQMREAYRTSARRIELDRAKRLQPLQTTFAKSLDAVVTHLTSAGKLDEATALRKYRDALTRTGAASHRRQAPLRVPSVGWGIRRRIASSHARYCWRSLGSTASVQTPGLGRSMPTGP